MSRQKNMFQTKVQNITPEKEVNKMKIINLPDKEFKIMIIRILSELKKSMYEHRENFNNNKMKRNQSELKNTTEIAD